MFHIIDIAKIIAAVRVGITRFTTASSIPHSMIIQLALQYRESEEAKENEEIKEGEEIFTHMRQTLSSELANLNRRLEEARNTQDYSYPFLEAYRLFLRLNYILDILCKNGGVKYALPIAQDARNAYNAEAPCFQNRGNCPIAIQAKAFSRKIEEFFPGATTKDYIFFDLTGNTSLPPPLAKEIIIPEAHPPAPSHTPRTLRKNILEALKTTATLFGVKEVELTVQTIIKECNNTQLAEPMISTTTERRRHSR